MKTPVATGNSQISFTDQVLNMKEFTSLIQSEATGPSNTTQQTGTVNFRFKHVRFKEVFRVKEEFHCSQNFST